MADSDTPEPDRVMGRVMGYSLIFTSDPEYTEMKPIHEDMARQEFKRRYGFEADNIAWLYEAAYAYYDERSYEEVRMPARWMLLVEGLVEKDGA